MWKNYFKEVGRRALIVASLVLIVWLALIVALIVLLFWFGYPLTALGIIGLWMAIAFGRAAAKADDELRGF